MAITRKYKEVQPDTSAGNDPGVRMQATVDAIWSAFREQGVSWVGFYLPQSENEMVLGPSRNKPACSPIGMHGACGRAFLSRRPLIVRDVKNLGGNYVACDPRDRSELVIPLLDETGASWAVLDLDSHETDAFSESDVTGLTAILVQAGLHDAPAAVLAVEVV